MWDIINRIVAVIVMLSPLTALAFAVWWLKNSQRQNCRHELGEIIHLMDNGHSYYAITDGGHTYWFEHLDVERSTAVASKLVTDRGRETPSC